MWSAYGPLATWQSPTTPATQGSLPLKPIAGVYSQARIIEQAPQDPPYDPQRWSVVLQFGTLTDVTHGGTGTAYPAIAVCIGTSFFYERAQQHIASLNYQPQCAPIRCGPHSSSRSSSSSSSSGGGGGSATHQVPLFQSGRTARGHPSSSAASRCAPAPAFRICLSRMAEIGPQGHSGPGDLTPCLK